MSKEWLAIVAESAIPALNRLIGDGSFREIQRLGKHVVILEAAADNQTRLDQIPGILATQGSAAATDQTLTESERLGIAAWNLRHSAEHAAKKKHRPFDKENWDASEVREAP